MSFEKPNDQEIEALEQSRRESDAKMTFSGPEKDRAQYKMNNEGTALVFDPSQKNIEDARVEMEKALSTKSAEQEALLQSRRESDAKMTFSGDQKDRAEYKMNKEGTGLVFDPSKKNIDDARVEMDTAMKDRLPTVTDDMEVKPELVKDTLPTVTSDMEVKPESVIIKKESVVVKKDLPTVGAAEEIPKSSVAPANEVQKEIVQVKPEANKTLPATEKLVLPKKPLRKLNRLVHRMRKPSYGFMDIIRLDRIDANWSKQERLMKENKKKWGMYKAQLARNKGNGAKIEANMKKYENATKANEKMIETLQGKREKITGRKISRKKPGNVVKMPKLAAKIEKKAA
ncbi:MAG: hypothetical protein PHV42_03095 [Candidatus Pacebacteria bacterium]|nr:hypothetical protein [Candidatus Paceibacterota bacterium]